MKNINSTLIFENKPSIASFGAVVGKKEGEGPLGKYFDLCEKLSDDTLTDYEKIIIKIAFITGKSEDEIWNLSWQDFRNLQESEWC